MLTFPRQRNALLALREGVKEKKTCPLPEKGLTLVAINRFFQLKFFKYSACPERVFSKSHIFVYFWTTPISLSTKSIFFSSFVP